MKRYLLLILCGTILSLAGGELRAAGRVVLSEAAVRQIITEHLLQRTEHLGVEIRLKALGQFGEVTLPPGRASYEVVAPPDWEGWGRGALALIVRVDDRVVKNIPLTVEVEAVGPVVVAARPLDFGTVIRPGDVVVQKRDIAQIPGRVCRTIDEAVGKRVRVGMRLNTPVRSDSLERPPLVKNGQMVTIIVENGAFMITATGRARSNGAEGDLVMVQNLNSSKEIPAVVLRDGTVRVEF